MFCLEDVVGEEEEEEKRRRVHESGNVLESVG